VKSGVANAAKLTSLLKKLGSPDPVPSAGEGETGYDDPIAVIVFSFLLWEATTSQAQDGMRKIVDSIVDFNELRVSLPTEVISVIGSRYPNSMERAQRLKSVLHSIYLAHHAVSLDALQSGGKREIRAFVEGLDGIPPYVSSRVLHRCFEVHTIPVDDRLVDLFVEHGVLSEIACPDEVSKWLSRQVKSSDGIRVEAALRSFVDSSPKPPARKAPPKPKAEAKPASKPAEPAATADPAPTKKAAKKSSSKTEKKAPAKKAPAKKAAAKKAPAKKAPAKKAAAKTAKKATKVAKKVAKKAPAKKAAKKTAKKAAKKTASKKSGRKSAR
jgi:hypothetical protein